MLSRAEQEPTASSVSGSCVCGMGLETKVREGEGGQSGKVRTQVSAEPTLTPCAGGCTIRQGLADLKLGCRLGPAHGLDRAGERSLDLVLALQPLGPRLVRAIIHLFSLPPQL